MHFRRQRDILLTLQERRSRLTLARRLLSKDADLAASAIVAELRWLPARARRTVTHDNGGEFARHEAVTSAIGLHAYFCDPHSPWQRGSIENANGRLRRDLPRKTSLAGYTDADIDDVIWNLNATPRKCLGYRTPIEAFAANLSWQFWVNMHGHFSDNGQCRGALGSQTGMSTVQLWSTNNTAEENTWCQCKHGVDAFLTWYRMYLQYFERVLRQAAGSTTLRLAYWDERSNGQLPAIHRAATYVSDEQTVPNPLRIADRRNALNAGTARLATAVTTPTNAMAATDYPTFRRPVG